MTHIKKAGVLLLTLVFVFGFFPAACAAVDDTGFSDVAAGAWYADAVAYCVDNSLMSGTGAASFEPEAPTSRAMLTVVLHRAAGAPAVSSSAAFADVPADAWYLDAVRWAAAEGILAGYENGLFGSEDPVTREQIAAILWRSENSPAPAAVSAAFADQSAISPFAVDAVIWARENGIISGKNNNRFDPQGFATRAEVAAILMNYLRADLSVSNAAPDGEEPDEGASEPQANILVTYFTRTGTTEAMAQAIHAAVGGDLIPLEPVSAYPSDYQQTLTQAQQELQANARPELATTISDMDSYDVIFIGYPIWHGTAPMAVLTFLEGYDLSGKTIIPFATSGSSGSSASERVISEVCPDSTLLGGLCLTSSSSGSPQAPVTTWLETLNLPLSAE